MVDPSTKRCSTCKKRKPPEHLDVCRPKKRKQFLSTEETKLIEQAFSILVIAMNRVTLDQNVYITQLQALVRNQSAIITNQQNELQRLTQKRPNIPSLTAPVVPGPTMQHQRSGIQTAPRHPQMGYTVLKHTPLP